MKSVIYKKYIVLFFILMIGLIFMSFLLFENHRKMPEAEKGIIDLTQWDIKKDGPIELEGEWEFYWNRLLNYDDFHGGENYIPDGYFHVPNVWNTYKLNNKQLPAEGCATYRLKIKTNNITDLKGIKY